MSEKQNNLCTAAPKLIFPCSGAADVGEISDLVGRLLTKKGAGKMFCLAGIGGHVEGIVKTAKSAAKILIIDGCPVECAKLCCENAGITDYIHMLVTDLGLEKGKTAVSTDNTALVTAEAEKRLQDSL
jgi:uncharacterized metal-binding protein